MINSISNIKNINDVNELNKENIYYNTQINKLNEFQSTTQQEKKLKSILKKQEILITEERIVVNPKKVKWDSNHSIRIIKSNNKIIDDKINEENKIFDFFKEKNALSNKKRVKKKKISKWVKNFIPEQLKEVKVIIENSISELNDKKLLKNYRRLKNKQQHVYSKIRDFKFELRINHFIFLYKNEIQSRILSCNQILNRLEELKNSNNSYDKLLKSTSKKQRILTEAESAI